MPNNPFVKPSPGLRGDYTDSCIVCMRGTDTGLAFRGEAEWVIAALELLGLDSYPGEAMTVFNIGSGRPPGVVLSGIITHGVRVCADCVARAKPDFPAPRLLATGVPVIEQLNPEG